MAKQVSPHEAYDLMQKSGYTYVDVRSVEEFEAGHPQGAVNIPLMLRQSGQMVPNPKFFDALSGKFSPEAPLILGCQAGGRSARAVQMLEQAGYRNVADSFAGWGGGQGPTGIQPGWHATGLPVDRGQPAERSWASLQG